MEESKQKYDHSQKYWQKRLKKVNQKINKLYEEKDFIVRQLYGMFSQEVIDAVKFKLNQEEGEEERNFQSKIF